MPINPLIVCTHAIWNFTTEKYVRHQNVFAQKGLDYFKKNGKGGEVGMIQIDMTMPTQCDCCRFCLTEYTDDNKPDSYAYCCVAERFIAQSNDGTDKVVSTAIIKKQQWCPLKEQEPRVLTAENFDTQHDLDWSRGLPAWVEYWGGHTRRMGRGQKGYVERRRI